MTVTSGEDKIKWWKDAKFGMFIHWGLYAALGRGEWVMYELNIPVRDYERLAETFNPIRFNAKTWVGLAKAAGMKYIVITAKHHDGFAMFRSQAEPFNIADATPFGRDPMRELAEECREQGIVLCFYYSHVIDWHHPHAVHNKYNNVWDYETDSKHFPTYWNGLVKPQIRELLTQYGPVGLLWFDTAGGLSKEDSEELVELVRGLQPDCLINSRVSHYPGMGDYQSKGDNEIPMYGEDSRAWETPMTLNQSWGFSTKDQVWKQPEAIIRKLVHIVSKGGNLLLNIGPDAGGLIPDLSAERLREVGAWLSVHGEAVYGAGASPFPYEMEWGSVTVKPGRVYLHLTSENWPQGELSLYGLKNKVNQAYVLSDASRTPLVTAQSYDAGMDHHTLAIRLPDEPANDCMTVIAVDIEGEISVDTRLSQQPSGHVKLEWANGVIDAEAKTVEWSFQIVAPGTFDLELVCFQKEGASWDEAFREGVEATSGGQQFTAQPKADQVIKNSTACQHPYSEVHSQLGTIVFDRPGTCTLSLHSALIRPKSGFTEIWQADPVKLRAVKLVKRQ
ncbi:alpha-L-fucosidase [Paenibacillus oleatilyticus]|uniref:alpha-L-fucosidase n=1 Tax=Paenibacillus oleatilyticus TaxID=2594886 RepID=UPI001C1FE339|nr:alpha-L-fucosidase [Paenibacillus oleatilyticus]MBU7320937.1 alpha-L-fucosidase [Paenibacillus oleatilyticus]